MQRLHSSAGSSDSGIGQTGVGRCADAVEKIYFNINSIEDATYEDPLGPLPNRPRTGAGKPLDFDDFADEQLGDDLLPE